jgi:hypothetical protein
MEAFTNGVRQTSGKMKLGSGRGKVVLSFDSPVTQVQLTPDEAERVGRRILEEARAARPLIFLPEAALVLGAKQ